MKLTIQKLKTWLLVLPLLLSVDISRGQTSPGYIDGFYSVYAADAQQWYGDVTLAAGATLYIEAGAKILFYGTNFKIMPGAKIYTFTGSNFAGATEGAGTGTIVFQQPNPNNNSTVQQTLDGGSTFNNMANTIPTLEINNPMGVKLVNTNARIGSNLQFTAGHLFLDAYNAFISTAATITGADATKYVVTASSGHLAKESFATAFVFPVGMAVADYTPATITPAGANTVYVNVTNYASDAPVESGTYGMDRVWNIYGSTSTGATIALQHNTVTNQATFTTTGNYITRYGTSPNNTGVSPSTDGWQVNTPSGSTVVGGTETNSLVYATLATTAGANEAWYTKSSNPLFATPDLIPVITMRTTTYSISGIKTRDFVLNTREIKGVPTDGSDVVISISLPTSFILTFDPATTSVIPGSGTAVTVNNSDWTMTQSGSFLILRSKPGVIIGANGVSKIGFTLALKNAVNAALSEQMTFTIMDSSGGELESDGFNNITTLQVNLNL